MDSLRKVSAGLVALTASTVYAHAPHAAAPRLKGQAPGYYRMLLGDFEIVALSDGTVPLDVRKLLTNTTPTRVDQLLKRSFLADPVETSVNAFLVNTGTTLVLIDTGSGNLFGPTLGNLAANLKAAGYQPEQVDEIYITHMHPDHVGGLMAGEKPAFPNAVVRADKREADYWLSQGNLDAAPDDAKGFFKGAMASIQPYVAAGKFKPFEGGGELRPASGLSPRMATRRVTRCTSSKAKAKGLPCWATSCTWRRCSSSTRRSPSSSTPIRSRPRSSGRGCMRTAPGGASGLQCRRRPRTVHRRWRFVIGTT